jgi:hypothetical protein
MTRRSSTTIIACGLLGACACGSPTAPDVVAFTQCRPVDAGAVILLSAELRVVVVGVTTGRPLVGLPIQLVAGPGDFAIACPDATTNSEGIAAWTAIVGRRYSLVVRNQPVIVDRLVDRSDEWRVTVPE